MAEVDQTEITNAIRHYIERKIKSANLCFSPCPHMIIEEIFLQDVYKSVLDLNLFNLEEGHSWLPQYRRWIMRTKTPYYHLRKQIDLTRPLDSNDRRYWHFWLMIRNCLIVNNWFEKEIFKKCPSYFLIRFGRVAEEPEFFDHLERQLFLQRHEEGYQLGPHTDLPTRVFTCIFSFAECEGFEELNSSHREIH